MTQRWFAVGSSDGNDARAAGHDAATAALTGSDAKALIAFCSDDYDLGELSAGIAGAAPGVPVVGCTTAGEISPGRGGDASVVIAAFGGDGFSAATAVGTDASNDPRAAGAAAAASMAEVGDRQHTALLLLSDGLAGGQQDVVRGAYGVVGASVPLVGACAGDQLKMQRTWQLHGDRVLHDAVVGLALGSDAPLGVGVSHGWRKVGEPAVVTSSDATRVYVLDGEPALDVYLRRLGAPEACWHDAQAFTPFAMTHPLGLDRRAGTETRFVADANYDDRSLGLIATVPQGGLAWLMEGDEATVLDATDAACTAALDGLEGHAAIGALAFDCVARRGVIGDHGVAEEVGRIGDRTGHVPVAGFYSYGEIARTHGPNGFHNQALVVLAVA